MSVLGVAWVRRGCPLRRSRGATPAVVVGAVGVIKARSAGCLSFCRCAVWYDTLRVIIDMI